MGTQLDKYVQGLANSIPAPHTTSSGFYVPRHVFYQRVSWGEVEPIRYTQEEETKMDPKMIAEMEKRMADLMKQIRDNAKRQKYSLADLDFKKVKKEKVVMAKRNWNWGEMDDPWGAWEKKEEKPTSNELGDIAP